jgi:hypothetical protein
MSVGKTVKSCSEWYHPKTNKKLQVYGVEPYKMLPRTGSNAYVIDILTKFGISFTFNI